MKQQFRSLLFACTCAFFIIACSGKNNGSMAGELAGQAAKAYYDQLYMAIMIRLWLDAISPTPYPLLIVSS